MTIFLTGDTNFNHNNIIEYNQRPFKHVSEMNEEITRRWNEVVGKADIVYHLGDFGMGRVEELRTNLSRLNGRVSIIRGNHDESLSKLLEMGFCSISDELTLSYRGFIIIMSHYQDLINHGIEGIIHIHGHTHSMQQFWQNFINVSCEAWDYYPVELGELILKYKKQKREGSNGL